MRTLISFASVIVAGCVRLDGDHCANQGDPVAYCNAEHQVGYCSSCRAETNGCWDERPKMECDVAGATTVAGTGTSDATTTTVGSMSNSSTDPGPTSSTTASMDSSTGDPPPGCGNGIVEKSLGENCDGLDMPATECSDVALQGGGLSCYPPMHQLECTYDLTECTGAAQCGNGEIEGSEQCDLDNLNKQTCEALSEDYIGGTLTCTNAEDANPCTFNTTDCMPCLMMGDPCTEGECCAGLLCGALTMTCGLV